MSSDANAADVLRAAFPGIGSSDPVSYFSRTSDVFQALSFSWLFWPRLVELYGAVFLALDGHDREDILSRLAGPSGDAYRDGPILAWSELVGSYNSFEVAQLFYRWREPREMESAACQELAVILAETWRSRLRQEYPERMFSVNVVEADEFEELRLKVRQESPPLEAPDGWDGGRRYIEQ